MPGIDVDTRDRAGCTAAHFASKGAHDDPGVLELLASHGADMAAVNNTGQLPLHFVARAGKVSMSLSLLSLPAVCDTLHRRDGRWGKTAEEIARFMGHHAIADTIADVVRCCF
jgi:ankyrin repeat protein